jgi:hypothetical protein
MGDKPEGVKFPTLAGLGLDIRADELGLAAPALGLPPLVVQHLRQDKRRYCNNNDNNNNDILIILIIHLHRTTRYLRTVQTYNI